MNAIPCSICNEGGHKSSLCPSLYAPLKEGFYAPPAGHRPSEDDDDEKLNETVVQYIANPTLCLKFNSKLEMLSPTRRLTLNTTAAVTA